jgi:ElaB/YqjD/DUF883 family membrane-anchored ribosome-binding protein
MIEHAEEQDAPDARQVADKGRRILSLSQELARDIAELTRTQTASAYRKLRETAEHDVDVVAQCVRDRPLTSVAVAAATGAALVCLMPHSGGRRDR